MATFVVNLNPQPAKGIELIQQWQYLGKAHPELLEDKAFKNCKKAGLTSIQSYVYWAEIEKEPDKIDFSTYDVLVERLAKHGLKWVPFLILGPNYATPKWFQESRESVYAKCLEHHRESKTQSIWNPFLPKWIDKFLRIVAEHYRNCDVLESILLGISGDWGEAIYPMAGGFYGGSHTHPGWWCGDKYAFSNFCQFALERYKSLQKLNVAWGINFSDLEEISFPPLRYRWGGFPHKVFSLMPIWARSRFTFLWKFLKFVSNKRPKFVSKIPSFTERRWWLDFVEWYMNSMTKYAEFWVRTARKYFPDTEIYLVTGGIGEPMLGADFSAQTKMVAKYNAGIRITNQTDNYAESFIFTRLVSSASRFYGAYFTTEEAGVNQPQGVIARVFDAATSGAKGFHCKSIIGIGEDICTGRSFPIGEPTKGALNLRENVQHLTLSEPIIDVAVIFPNTSIALNPTLLSLLYNQCSKLRDVLDFDLVDENMMADGALKRYRFLVLLDGNWLRLQTMIEIRNRVRDGGILITTKHSELFTVGGNRELHRQLFSQPERIEKFGNGYVLLFNGKGRGSQGFIAKAVYNRDKIYPWTGLPEIDNEFDGVYATRFADKIMYYNSSDSTVRKSIGINNLLRRKSFEINVKPHSMVAVDLDRGKV